VVTSEWVAQAQTRSINVMSGTKSGGAMFRNVAGEERSLAGNTLASTPDEVGEGGAEDEADDVAVGQAEGNQADE